MALALQALRIGVVSLRHAAGAVDVDSVPRASEGAGSDDGSPLGCARHLEGAAK